MLRLSLLCCTTLLSTAVLAEPLSCDQLKADIEVKIQSAGVTAYTLEAVPNAEVRDPPTGPTRSSTSATTEPPDRETDRSSAGCLYSSAWLSTVCAYSI